MKACRACFGSVNSSDLKRIQKRKKENNSSARRKTPEKIISRV